MALIGVDPASRILDLLNTVEPRLRTALLNAITATKQTLTLELLAELITNGRFEDAIEAAAAAGAIRLADGSAAIFTLAGSDGSKFLSDILDVTVGFDQVNERAVDIMRQERLRLIREFSAGQRAATRAALTDGIRRGVNPIEQARNFRGSIGLTVKQQQAVERYRTLLEQGSSEAMSRDLRDRRFDPSLRRAIRNGTPLRTDQIDRMVSRYSERMLTFRANTIARTESLRALHLGNHQAYTQAIEQGVIGADDLRRKWVTAGDERVRGSHASLHGTIRGIQETFPGFGGPLRFPGDPSAPASETINCRCSLSTRIDSP